MDFHYESSNLFHPEFKLLCGLHYGFLPLLQNSFYYTGLLTEFLCNLDTHISISDYLFALGDPKYFGYIIVMESLLLFAWLATDLLYLLVTSIYFGLSLWRLGIMSHPSYYLQPMDVCWSS